MKKNQEIEEVDWSGKADRLVTREERQKWRQARELEWGTWRGQPQLSTVAST